jgi:hypothetical protein
MENSSAGSNVISCRVSPPDRGERLAPLQRALLLGREVVSVQEILSLSELAAFVLEGVLFCARYVGSTQVILPLSVDWRYSASCQRRPLELSLRLQGRPSLSSSVLHGLDSNYTSAIPQPALSHFPQTTRSNQTPTSSWALVLVPPRGRLYPWGIMLHGPLRRNFRKI